VNARNKGNKGEREWRDVLNSTFGAKFARTPLSGGLDLKGDIMRTYGSPKTIADEFHWEIKRVEKLNIHQAMAQAIRDSRPPLLPCVPFRRNHEEWMICIQAKDFLNLLVELSELRQGASKDNREISEFEKHIIKKEMRRKARKEAEKKWSKKRYTRT